MITSHFWGSVFLSLLVKPHEMDTVIVESLKGENRCRVRTTTPSSLLLFEQRWQKYKVLSIMQGIISSSEGSCGSHWSMLRLAYIHTSTTWWLVSWGGENVKQRAPVSEHIWCSNRGRKSEQVQPRTSHILPGFLYISVRHTLLLNYASCATFPCVLLQSIQTCCI